MLSDQFPEISFYHPYRRNGDYPLENGRQFIATLNTHPCYREQPKEGEECTSLGTHWITLSNRVRRWKSRRNI